MSRPAINISGDNHNSRHREHVVISCHYRLWNQGSARLCQTNSYKIYKGIKEVQKIYWMGVCTWACEQGKCPWPQQSSYSRPWPDPRPHKSNKYWTHNWQSSQLEDCPFHNLLSSLRQGYEGIDGSETQRLDSSDKFYCCIDYKLLLFQQVSRFTVTKLFWWSVVLEKI